MNGSGNFTRFLTALQNSTQLSRPLPPLFKTCPVIIATRLSSLSIYPKQIQIPSDMPESWTRLSAAQLSRHCHAAPHPTTFHDNCFRTTYRQISNCHNDNPTPGGKIENGCGNDCPGENRVPLRGMSSQWMGGEEGGADLVQRA
jgi:hypothetical protein